MNTFSVKNFEKFQHYKDRSPPWIKLYNELLENYEFGRLPDHLKGQLIGIWLLASRMDNKLPYDPRWIAAKINATDPVDLDALLDANFIQPWGSAAAGKREQWPSRYIPEATRAAILERDGRKCVRCSATDRLEIDHITPVSRGGTGEASNLQVLCVSCNRKKRAAQLRSNGNAETEICVARSTQMRSLERETETEKKDGGGDAREAPRILISEEASGLADEVAALAGLDPSDPMATPPGWCGASARVQTWLASWSREAILAGVQAGMSRKRDGPPETPKYFEKSIARMHAQISAPVPVAEEMPHVQAPDVRTGWQASRDDFRAARAKLHARVLALEAGSGESG